MPRAQTIFSRLTLVRSIWSSGLKPWLSSVRRHDNQFDGLGFHSISSVTGTKPRLPPLGGGVEPGPAARAGACAAARELTAIIANAVTKIRFISSPLVWRLVFSRAGRRPGGLRAG